MSFAASSGYLGEWYDAQTTFEDARVVTVTSPGFTTGIDAELL